MYAQVKDNMITNFKINLDSQRNLIIWLHVVLRGAVLERDISITYAFTLTSAQVIKVEVKNDSPSWIFTQLDKQIPLRMSLQVGPKPHALLIILEFNSSPETTA